MTFRERVDIISCPTAPAVTPLTHTPLGAHGVGAGFQQSTAHQGRVIVFKRKKKKQETNKMEDTSKEIRVRQRSYMSNCFQNQAELGVFLKWCRKEKLGRVGRQPRKPGQKVIK